MKKYFNSYNEAMLAECEGLKALGCDVEIREEESQGAN